MQRAGGLWWEVKKEPDYVTTCLYLFKDLELYPKEDKSPKGFKDFSTYIILFNPCKVGIMNVHSHEETGVERDLLTSLRATNRK